MGRECLVGVIIEVTLKLVTDLEVFNRYHRQAAALATEKVQVNYSKS